MSGFRVLVVIAVITALLLVVWFMILGRGDVTFQSDLWKEAGKTLLQLILVGILGIFAKFLLDQYATERLRQMADQERERTGREELWKSQIAALNSLTTSYWQVKKALHIIYAHRSAKSYGEQVRQIIDYRLELQRLNNEISANMYGFDDQTKITENLYKIDKCLEEVIDEWKNEYLRLSQLQKKDEVIDEPGQKKVPDAINKLPVLNRIREERFELIHAPFEGAVAPIRKHLRSHLMGIIPIPSDDNA